MEITQDDTNSASARGLNYFNYFTEVEEEFVRRRGKPLMISPIDWALVETWKNANIPLHIVLRAINEAFDGYDTRGQKHRKVNSIFYCQQQVESTFADYRTSQVGGSTSQESGDQIAPDESSARSTPESAFPKEVVVSFLATGERELDAASSRAVTAGRIEIADAVNRARERLAEIVAEIQSSSHVNAQALERDLDAIDRMVLEAAKVSLGDDEIKEIRTEAESQLRSHRKKMDKAIYEQTVQNFVSRRLREANHIPRLSLFYL